MESRQIIDCCVVGMGPAGIGVAHVFEQHDSSQKILYMDAGLGVEDRSCAAMGVDICARENPCKVISGFGGCSLLSGSKISLFPAGSGFQSILGSGSLAEYKLNEAKDVWLSLIGKHQNNASGNWALESEKYKRKGFEYKYYEALSFSSEQVRSAFVGMAGRLKDKESLFTGCVLRSIDKIGPTYQLICEKDKSKIVIETPKVIMGLGKMGRKLYQDINEKFKISAVESHIDIGVRLEFPNEVVQGLLANHRDLKLKFGNARTYCVCQDGRVIPYFLEEAVFTEGICDDKERTGHTNLAIFCRFPATINNETLFGDIKNRVIRNNNMPTIQGLSEYLGEGPEGNTREGTLKYARYGNINNCFPQEIAIEIKDRVGYFVKQLVDKQNVNSVNVYGPEVDYNGLIFPVRSDFSVLDGLYIVGSGTGHFRGILQSFSSGLICANSIV